MFALISRTLARAAAIVALAGVSLIIADAASAKPIFLSGKHSRGEIMGACAAASGTYQDNGKSGTGGQYGCVTAKGVVVCDSSGGCGGDCKKCADVSAEEGRRDARPRQQRRKHEQRSRVGRCREQAPSLPAEKARRPRDGSPPRKSCPLNGSKRPFLEWPLPSPPARPAQLEIQRPTIRPAS